jgi:hypothetical protein
MPTAVPITATPLTTPPTPARTAPDPIRQIAVLAIAAFVIGFVGFLALGLPIPSTASTSEPPAVAVAQPADESLAASPASDDWNLPKKI